MGVSKPILSTTLPIILFELVSFIEYDMWHLTWLDDQARIRIVSRERPPICNRIVCEKMNQNERKWVKMQLFLNFMAIPRSELRGRKKEGRKAMRTRIGRKQRIGRSEERKKERKERT